MTSFRVLVAEPEDFSDSAIQILERAGEVVLEAVRSPGELSAAMSDYDAVFLRLRFRITSELLPEDPRCRLLAVPTTGLDHIDLDACARRGVEIVSLSGEREFLKSVRATAEHTVALALALIRRLPQAFQSVLDGEWDRDRFRGNELYGKTAGVVGLGRLGVITAGYFHALGMRVLGFDVRDDVDPSPALPVDSMTELLGRSDLVSIHVNYRTDTRHLFDSTAFERMKRGALLINTSRGGVVDEAALLAALDSGRLAGAALDVLDGEPGIGDRHPVVQYAKTHPNLLVTPHIGGNTFESFGKTEAFIARKIVSKLELQDQGRG